MKNNYNQNYFDWQKKIGEFGGKINLIKFRKYIKKNDNLIDFGCGGGFLLDEISCKNKIGIEPNKSARKFASKRGIKIVSNYKYIDNLWADIIISNHVLEHTKNPYNEIIALKKKLKSGGKMVFYVPSDHVLNKFKKNDINKHLYSWSPMTLGNLFESAGLNIVKISSYLHKWPKHYLYIYKFFGEKTFHLISYLNGFLKKDSPQIMIVARKP